MATRRPPRERRDDAFAVRYGPWAVVTGASSGIGREIARELARRGLHVVLVSRRADVLESLAVELAAEFGVEATTVPVDLGGETALAAVVAATRDLDVGLVVAAAGFGTSGSLLQATPATEYEMLAVNCRAVLDAALHFGPRLAARGRGGLVLVSSVVAFQGVPWSAHYSATKAYVQTLAEALHAEWAPQGVDVLASAPGPTTSGFADRAGLAMGAAASAADVARHTIAALGRTATVRPGGLAKLLGWSLAMLPRWARVRVMGGIMRGMAR